MTKTYLVTGGTGFIGSALVKSLLLKGNKIRVLDNDSRGVASRLHGLKGDLELIQGDIRDVNDVNKATQGVDSVIHLAYVNGTEFFYSKPEYILEIAIKGMINVVDSCRKNHVRELILASSSEVYQTPPSIPTAEDAPLVVPDVLNPRYSYGGGKLACELIAMNYGLNDFDRVMVFRPHNVYGKDMGYEHVIPQLSMRAFRESQSQTKGKVEFKILGSGEQTRAFCHIDDFVKAIEIMIEKGEHLNIYHIGNPEEITIRRVAQEIFSCLGREYEIITSNAPEGETSRRCPDIEKIEKLGFNPTINFSSGIKEVAEWYFNNAK